MYKGNSVSRFLVAVVFCLILAIWLVSAGTGAVKETKKIVNKRTSQFRLLDAQIGDASASCDYDAPSPLLTEESGAPTVTEPDTLVAKEGAASTPIKPLAIGFIVLLGSFISITVYLNKKCIK